jgi:hypothetical protein
MNSGVDMKRVGRVHNQAIFGFTQVLENDPDVLLSYCNGEHPSTGGQQCAFLALCSRRIANGKLSLQSVYSGATGNEQIAQMYNQQTGRKVPTNRFNGLDMPASFVGMNANCTDVSTLGESNPKPPPVKQGNQEPDKRPRYGWQNGWGGDK